MVGTKALDHKRPSVALTRKASKAEMSGHLFVPVHWTALPYPVADGLWIGDVTPPHPPPLPAAVTHLWLAPQLGRRVLLWAPTGWQQHDPYD